MKKLRMGVIGCGNMGTNHAEGFRKLSDVMEITAACDINEESLAAFASHFENCFATTDYREMVDYVDAVLVSLPHDLHFNCGMFFARNKKHILMEKPLCNMEEECLRLIKACDEEGVKLMTAYPVPYIPSIIKLKEYADSGEYGTPFHMSIFTEQLTVNPDEFAYAFSSHLGGGQLFSHGCHYIDLILWFMGEPVEGVHIGTNKGTPWMIKEGTSSVALKFKNGATGLHYGTWGARGTKMFYDYQIFTDKGLLALTDGEVRFYTGIDNEGFYVDAVSDYEVLWKSTEPKAKNTHHEIRHFIDCVLNDKTPMTDGRRGIQSLRVIWKLYEAEKRGEFADLRGLGINQFDDSALEGIYFDNK